MVVAESADRLERKAQAKNPSKYNPRNPWPKVDEYAAQARAAAPVNLMPEEDFSNRAIAERELVEGQVEGQNVLRFLRYAKNPELAAAQESGAEQAALRKIKPEFWSNKAEETMRKSIARRVDRNNVRKLSTYPSILNAVVQAQASGQDVDENDVARLIDYVAADQAAEMILSTNDKVRQQNILKTANPIMRAAIGDIIAEKLAQAAVNVEEGEGNVLINALGTGLSYTLKPFEFGWEKLQQTLRFSLQENPFMPPTMREKPTPWGEFDSGNFNQDNIDQLKKEYDPLAVDIMVDIAKAQASGSEDHVGQVMAMDKYGSDEAGIIFRQLLYAADSNPELMELARKIDEANLGTTGPVLFNSFFGDLGTGTVWRERTSGGLSVAAGFIDPTIFAGRAINAYRGVKYALNKLAPGEDVSVALASRVIGGVETNTSRRYFDRLITDLRALDEIADPGEAARVRQVISRQYKEVPDEVITEIRNQSFRDVDEFAGFINQANDANILIRGGIVPEANIAAQSILAEKNLFERLYTTLPQTRQAMIPRMSLGRFLRQQGAIAVSATVMPKARAKQVIKDFYGNNATAEDVAKVMFDNGLAIGALDQSRSVLEKGALGRSIDRFFQKFASLPNKNFITTSDASDSKTFYMFARSYLTKYHATYLTDVFRAANPGQRRLLIAGLIRSAAASRGVDFGKETILHRIDDLATGYSAEELYSAGRVERLTAQGTLEGAEIPVDAIGQVDDLITIRPSNVNGREHALHLWQTADGVAIPHMKDIEDLKAYRNLQPEWLQRGVNLPQTVTDMWSLGTLYGFRFSQRAAAEDYWGYVVTSGRLDYLYKGRKAAMALRETRPNISVVAGADGNNEVKVKSRLGMFAKRFRKVGDKVQSKADYASPSLTSQILSVAFLENLNEAEVLAANVAFKNGDAEALKALYLKSMARYRLSGLTDQNMDDLADLVDTSFGLKQIDDVTEQGAMINSGALPNPNLSVPGTDLPGIKTFSLPDDAKTVFGAFVDIPKGSKNYNLFWFNSLHGILELDGPIGKIAVSDIANKDRAVSRIAEAIRNDTNFGYRDRLSMIYTGDVSIDEFARRYYDDVRNMFSDADGNLNIELLNRVAPVGDDGFRIVDIYDVNDAGENVLKLSPAGMREYSDKAPGFVLGRNEIPMPETDADLIDKAWNVLGEQYNRISKEPILMANYLEQRDLLRGYEQQLAGVVGEKASKRIVKNMSLERAIGFTLSYSDNPANRSQLAWKVRNFSRYYRATEDFYRRSFRMAKNNPVAFWKTALTYQLLDDTGVIMEDDNGNKYFAYPGSDILQSAIRASTAWLFGDNIHLDLKPSFFGGQVNMLAPSSDINQTLPTPTGPVGVIPFKLLFSKFPELQKFERYILGEYAATGSWYDSLIPGQAARVLKSMSTDERYSLYGSSIMDALAIAVAEDLIPSDFDNIDQISQSDEMQGIRNIAWGTVVTKLLLGFTVPASPQVYSETATDYARDNGIESMRSAFLELVRAYDGDIQKAYRQWWRLNKDGDLMPFTVSRTEVSKDKIASFADVQPVMGLEKWYTDNKTLYKKYPNASLLLAPKTGKFSFDSWNVLTRTLGLRTPKDVNDFMLDALSAKTQYQYMATLADYRKDIDQLDPRIEEDRKRITELEEMRSEDVKWLENQDPFWAQNRAENANRSQATNYAQTMYSEAKQMVNDLKNQGKADDISSSIRSAIYTYEDYMTDIKMITGNTEAEREMKRQLRYEMERDLESIASRNENVKSFIENVLYWEPEVGEL
jgi:hypothetical protein